MVNRRHGRLIVAFGLATVCACATLDGLSTPREEPTPSDASACGEDCGAPPNETGTPSDAGGLADVQVPSCLAAPDDPALLDDAVALASTVIGFCALLKDGRVACWGQSGATFGNLVEDGGPLTTSATPRFVPGVSDAVKIAGGYGSMCVVDRAGRVMCWGSNSSGTLGRGAIDAGEGRDPAPVVLQNAAPVTTAIDVAMGNSHGCALLQGGVVVCWGDSRSGQLGPVSPAVNDAGMRPYADLAIGGGALGLATGAFHTCAIQSPSPPTLTCWGLGSSGQLGVPSDGGSASPVTVPLAASGGSAPSAVFAGGQSTCARDVDGRLYCWGSNSIGQLGQLGVGSNLTAPTLFQGLDNAVVAHVEIGVRHACYTLDSGVATCVGSNAKGELGRRNFTSTESNLEPVVMNEAGAPLGPVVESSITKVPLSNLGSTCAIVRRCGGGTRTFCWGLGSTVGSPSGGDTALPLPVAAPTP